MRLDVGLHSSLKMLPQALLCWQSHDNVAWQGQGAGGPPSTPDPHRIVVGKGKGLLMEVLLWKSRLGWCGPG